MTVTAFIKDKEEEYIYLASDKQVTSNKGIYNTNSKIYKKEIKYNEKYFDIYIGRAGNLVYTNLLENYIDLWPNQKLNLSCESFEEWWLKYIVPQFDDFIKNMALEKNNIDDDFAHFIIIFNGEIYQVIDYYMISKLDLDFHAIGDGANHCIGVISALLEHTSLNKEFILKEAIKNTENFSSWCSGVSEIIKIKIK